LLFCCSVMIVGSIIQREVVWLDLFIDENELISRIYDKKLSSKSSRELPKESISSKNMIDLANEVVAVEKRVFR